MPLHDTHIRLLCGSGIFNDVIAELLNSLSEEFVAVNAGNPNVNPTVNQSALSVVLQQNQSTVAKLNTASLPANKSKIYDILNNVIKQSPDVSSFDTTLICELLCGIGDFPTYCGKKSGTIPCHNTNISCVGKCCKACSHTCTQCGKVKCPKACTAHRACNHQCMSCQMVSSDCTYNKNICCDVCMLCGFCNSNVHLAGQCPRYRLKSNIIKIRHLRNICAHGTENDFDAFHAHKTPLPYFPSYTEWMSLSAMLTETLDDFISYLDSANIQFIQSNAYLSKDKIRSLRSELYIAFTSPAHKVKSYFDEYLKESYIIKELSNITDSVSNLALELASTSANVSEIKDAVTTLKSEAVSKADMDTTSEDISEIKDAVATLKSEAVSKTDIIPACEDISEIKDAVTTLKSEAFSKADMVLTSHDISEIKDVVQSIKKVTTNIAGVIINQADDNDGVPESEDTESEDTESNISVECTAEFEAYTSNKAHDIFAIVSLKAPSDSAYGERAAMDIVAVIDKSGSMEGKKLRLVKSALQYLITQLGEKDRLSLVTYDRHVYLDYSLGNMSMINKEVVSRKINDIVVGSCTNLCAGLIKGLCQIANRSSMSKNNVASVLLFTDGQANEGITHVVGITSAMKNPTGFDAPSHVAMPPIKPNKRQSMGIGRLSMLPKIEVDEDEEEDKEDCSPPVTEGTGATVYTFGVGAKHDPNMLKQISDQRNGMYYFIKNENQIGESFAHCIGGLMSTLAQGIQLQVTTKRGVFIKNVHTSKVFEQPNNKSLKVNIGDLQSEECRDVLLELSMHPVDIPYSSIPQCLFSVDVNYFNVKSKNVVAASGLLEVFRPENESSSTVLNMNEKVTKTKVRINVTNAIRMAIGRAEEDDFEGARACITAELEANKRRKYTKIFSKDYDAMRTDLNETYTSLCSKDTWKRSGVFHHLNVLQQHEVQRSSSNDQAYQTRAQRRSMQAFGAASKVTTRKHAIPRTTMPLY